jgi:hypothetical protein
MLRSEIINDNTIKQYKTYNVFGKNLINNNIKTPFYLGQIDIVLHLNGNKIRLDTIYNPSNDAKKWFLLNKERLNETPNGLSGLKPIHKYIKNYFFIIPENDKTNLIEKIKNMGFLYILDIQINEITKKITKRLNKEYLVIVDKN